MPLAILQEDDHILIVNKPATTAIQSANPDAPTLEQEAQNHCKDGVWLVHRIDQPVSGIVLFAKSAEVAAHLSAQFKNRTIEKEYLAFTAITDLPEEGLLEHYFERFAKNNKTKAWAENKPGRYQALLSYRRLMATDRYQLLLVQPLTGRQHQIRAQLAAAGCPIKGDVKYGARRKNPDRSIHLHAWRIRFTHPKSLSPVQITCEPPFQDVLWASAQKALQINNNPLELIENR